MCVSGALIWTQVSVSIVAILHFIAVMVFAFFFFCSIDNSQLKLDGKDAEDEGLPHVSLSHAIITSLMPG